MKSTTLLSTKIPTNKLQDQKKGCHLRIVIEERKVNGMIIEGI